MMFIYEKKTDILTNRKNIGRLILFAWTIYYISTFDKGVYWGTCKLRNGKKRKETKKKRKEKKRKENKEKSNEKKRKKTKRKKTKTK